MKVPRPGRHHLLAAGLLTVLAGASLLLRGPVRGAPGMTVPTTFSTEPGGLQGLYMVGESLGLRASRFTGRLEELDPASVPALAVVGFPVPEVDPALLLSWVEEGGRLLLATEDPRLLGPLRLRTEPVAGAGEASFLGGGRGWTIPPGTGPPRRRFTGDGCGESTVLATVGQDGSPWILELEHGAGTIFLLADAAPLTNGGLGTPANAILAVRLLEAAADGGPIGFCETIHGFGAGGDPDAALARMLLRTPFGNAVLGCALFTLLLLVADAKRFGRVRRTIERPRRSEYEYLDALAGLMVRARAWPQAGKLLLLGVARRSGREGRRQERLTVRAVAESLSWDRPAEATAIREGAEALAAGKDPRGMLRGLAALDRALPPERSHGAWTPGKETA